MRGFTLIAAIVVVAVALAGCDRYARESIAGSYPLRTEVYSVDGEVIFDALLTQPEFKDVADRVAPLTVLTQTLRPDGTVEKYYYWYQDGNVAHTEPTDPDFTVSTSLDLALSVLNAGHDGFRVFACALKVNMVTFEATNPVYAASFNGAKGRIVGSTTDCSPADGQKVHFRDLEGTLVDGSTHGLPRHVARMAQGSLINADDLLSYNMWRAPMAWHRAYCYDVETISDSDILVTDWCRGSGTTTSSSDLATCTAAVHEAYPEDDATDGWDAGLRAAEKARKAAELAACTIVFGGV